MIIVPFQELMANGQMKDALNFLEVMNGTFKDRNTDQKAASLIYACK